MPCVKGSIFLYEPVLRSLLRINAVLRDCHYNFSSTFFGKAPNNFGLNCQIFEGHNGKQSECYGEMGQQTEEEYYRLEKRQDSGKRKHTRQKAKSFLFW